MNILRIVNAVLIVNISAAKNGSCASRSDHYKRTAAPVIRCGCPCRKIYNIHKEKTIRILLMAMPAAMRTVRTALQGFSLFLIAHHAPHRQSRRACYKQSCYKCSHLFLHSGFSRFFLILTSFPHSAVAIFLSSTFSMLSSLYGLNSRYKSPASNTAAATVHTPNGTPKNRPPIL